MGEVPSRTSAWRTCLASDYPPGDAVYLVPIDGVASTEGRLRLEPTKNIQKRRTRLASEFAVETWTVNAVVQVSKGASTT